MKTTNWQTKALTLFIAAAALWLSTACTKEYPLAYPDGGLRIISSEPCEDSAPLVPSMEFVELAERETPPTMKYPTGDQLKELPGYADALDARRKRLDPRIERVRKALDEYQDKLRENENYRYSELYIEDGLSDVGTDSLTVRIYLDRWVDPRTVPPEDRIPGCIGGVPVHIIVDYRIYITQDVEYRVYVTQD